MMRPDARRPGWRQRLHMWDDARMLRQRLELTVWRLRGRRGTPPPGFKQRLVASYARRFAADILVETGTQLGDMLFANHKLFSRLISIELDPWLFSRARRRFTALRHVEIVHGDSELRLPAILPGLDGRALFWLDAHQMVGGVRGLQTTPIAAELDAILSLGQRDAVLLIDDARLFVGGDYPTIDEVRDRIRARRPEWVVEVADDVIRCHEAPRGRRQSPDRPPASVRSPMDSV